MFNKLKKVKRKIASAAIVSLICVGLFPSKVPWPTVAYGSSAHIGSPAEAALEKEERQIATPDSANYEAEDDEPLINDLNETESSVATPDSALANDLVSKDTEANSDEAELLEASPGEAQPLNATLSEASPGELNTLLSTSLLGLMPLTDDIETVEPCDINAKVRLFNYNSDVNDTTMGQAGYKFHNSASWIAKDGNGSSGSYNKPVMTADADENGYPNTEKGSLAYLFDGTNGHTQAFLKDGGGLFQWNSAEGYYYYDSALNAAYYDPDKESFVLYDCVARPSYTSASDDVHMGNFLPFNEVIGNVTIDNTTSTGISAGYYNDESDLWFGMMVEFDFYMPKDGVVDGKDMEFNFLGDDDVFVYIDDKLIIDIGGTHAARSGTIDFAAGTVTDYPATNSGYRSRTFADIFDADKLDENGIFKFNTRHRFKFFYLERGGNISYCQMKFNIPVREKNTVSVTKHVSVDTGDVDEILGDQEFTFQILDAETDEAFVPEETTYYIENAAGEQIGSGLTGEEGTFKIKKNQTAVFDDIEKEEGSYYIRELLKEEFKDQYGDITVDGEVKTTVGYVTVEGESFVGVESSVKEVTEGSSSFTYNNSVILNKTMEAEICKNVYGNADPDTVYDISVWVDDILLPAGTLYTVTEADGKTTRTETVNDAGIIKLLAEESASISRIMLGSELKVQETAGSAEGYEVSYGGENISTYVGDSGTFGKGIVVDGSPLQIKVNNIRENFIPTGTVTIRKEIPSREILTVDGAVVGLFRISGIDINGNSHSYTTSIAINAAEGTMMTGTAVIKDIPYGTYKVTEIETARFQLNALTVDGKDTLEFELGPENADIQILSEESRRGYEKFAHADVTVNSIVTDSVSYSGVEDTIAKEYTIQFVNDTGDVLVEKSGTVLLGTMLRLEYEIEGYTYDKTRFFLITEEENIFRIVLSEEGST